MPAIWKQPASVELLTARNTTSAPAHVGIEFLEVGDDYLSARMPVDQRTKQTAGILHGGMSVVLAETLGSCAASLAAPPGHRVVGLEINANHIRAVSGGWVTGVARPVHIGRTTQVWTIEITNEEGKVTCASRITMAMLVPAESTTA